MGELSRRAAAIMDRANEFKHPMIPVTALKVIRESAVLVFELAQRVEAIEKQGGTDGEATKR